LQKNFIKNLENRRRRHSSKRQRQKKEVFKNVQQKQSPYSSPFPPPPSGEIEGAKNYFMALEEKIMTDLKAAMLAKDEISLRSLRAIKAAIIIAKTAEGAGGVLKEEDEMKLLQKLVKQRKDSLEIFENQNRKDLAVKERDEIAVIEKFLPKQMGADELKVIIEKIINETGANSPAEMGKVMGIANKQLAGKADGKTIAAMVKELLTHVP